MRKQNSQFRARYLSAPGTQLHNNDFYASAEGDRYACYVIVDGLEPGDNEDPGARLAAEAVIEAFNERPSIGRLALYRYIQKAHVALSTSNSKKDLLASITVVVTDYQKVRYAHLGNTRFALFRKGALYKFSSDHSLSWSMMEEGEIPKDVIARHEERGNLSRCLGQSGLPHPQVSRKIKLADGDILALYSRGVWENCDEDDMLAEITDAGDDPKQAMENAERVLLDGAPDPDNVDNYTLSLVFVDKVYLDPNKGKRLKKVLKILIPVLIVLIIIGVILFFWLRDRRIKRENMEAAYDSGIQYIQDENYLKAKEELNTAYELATALRDKDWQSKIDEFNRMTEQVIRADNFLEAWNFNDAQAAYLRAQSRSRYTDNVARQYITRRLSEIEDYQSVHAYIALGDTLAEQGAFAAAEEKYLMARRLASQVFYAEGKQEAMSALEALYAKMQEEIDAGKDQAAAEIIASDYIIQGDNAVKAGDLTAAELYYTLAKEQYTKLGNEAVLESIEERLAALEQKKAEIEELLASAKAFVAEGDALMKQYEYAQAKRRYILARSIYSDLKELEKLEEVQEKIDSADESASIFN